MTRAELAERFADRVHADGLERALATTMRELLGAERETLEWLWREFGPKILRDLEREKRLRAITLTASAALRVLVPLGNTGARTSVGALSRNQLLAIARLRELVAQTSAEQARILKRIAEKVGAGTVADIWQRLSAHERRSFLDAVGARGLAEAA